MESSDVQTSGVETPLNINELVELFNKQTISYNECRSSYEAGKSTMAKLTAMFSQVSISPPTLDSKKRKYTKRQPVDASAQTEHSAGRVEKRKRTSSTSSEATLSSETVQSDSDGAESDSVKAPKEKAVKAPKEKTVKAPKEVKEKAPKAVKTPKETVVNPPNETVVIDNTQSIENITQSAEPVLQVEEADFTKTVISKAPKEPKAPKEKAVKEKAVKEPKAPKEKTAKAVKEPKAPKEKTAKAPKAPKEKADKAASIEPIEPVAQIEPQQENTPASEELVLENSEDGDSVVENGDDTENGDDNEDATDETVVTEKLWMDRRFLVDEATGDMYDLVTEKPIQDSRWDGFNVVKR